MTKRNRIIKKWIPVVIFITGILLLLAIKLVRQEQTITNNINFRLKAAAGTIELVINDALIEAAVEGVQPDSEQYRDIQNKFDRIAAIHEVDYAYVVIEKEDSIYFVVCNVLPSDIKNNLVIKYLDVFSEAPPELKAAFRLSKDVVFSKNSNKWGTFRSAYIRKTTESGICYLLCTDMFLKDINKELLRVLIEFLISLLYVVLISYPLIRLQINSLNRTFNNSK